MFAGSPGYLRTQRESIKKRFELDDLLINRYRPNNSSRDNKAHIRINIIQR